MTGAFEAGTAARRAAPSLPGVIRNAMTVDVEDYFQVQAFAHCIDRGSWDRIPCRVEANVDRILMLFDRAGVTATFFTLGWIAERHPAVIRRIVAQGHELASHGYGHQLADRLDPDEFRADIGRARRVLEDIAGVAIQGYRAPTFSIGARNPWAYSVLESEGHRYSSSVFPIRHDLYGSPDAPRVPFRPSKGAVWEIPMTTVRMGGRNLPCAGGGYFRLLPYAAYCRGLRHLHRTERRPGIFYFHPWEVDPGQPRVSGSGRLARFRHTVNLGAMERRLERLLRDFRWARMDQVFADVLDGPTRAPLAPPPVRLPA